MNQYNAKDQGLIRSPRYENQQETTTETSLGEVEKKLSRRREIIQQRFMAKPSDLGINWADLKSNLVSSCKSLRVAKRLAKNRSTPDRVERRVDRSTLDEKSIVVDDVVEKD